MARFMRAIHFVALETEQMIERDVRDRLLTGKLDPVSRERDARIFRAVRRICQTGTVFYVLTDTPEQTEDVFRILVDDTKVVSFELKRDSSEALPADVQIYTVDEYKNAVSGLAKTELKIALELAAKDLMAPE
jgi:hypothetical protein